MKTIPKGILKIDCVMCGSLTPTSESSIITVKSKYFGVVGDLNVRVCKECLRDWKLKELEL